jgi:hypothetical protein
MVSGARITGISQKHTQKKYPGADTGGKNKTPDPGTAILQLPLSP